MKKLIIPLILSLLLPIQAWAFPSTSVLDTFTGSDNTTPPSSNWTNGVTATATGQIWIQDNAIASVITGTFGDAYWNATSFGADCEAYATIVNTLTNIGAVWCRLANIGVSTTDGYEVLYVTASNVLRIRRRDNGTATQLGADISQATDADDAFGIKTVGDQICAWFNNDGAGWTELACRTDTTYTAGGYIGLGATSTNTVGGLDNFGGGNVVSGSAPQSSQGFMGAIIK